MRIILYEQANRFESGGVKLKFEIKVLLGTCDLWCSSASLPSTTDLNGHDARRIGRGSVNAK